ncbi:MAG TPA: DUF998 domain-containing protein [Chloroflexota bacterium]|nr:DUF998 domain-containing protein [Chloroflexota bacterium]
MQRTLSTTPLVQPRPLGVIAPVVVQVLAGTLSIVGGLGSLASGAAVPDGLGLLRPLAPIFPAALLVIGAFFLVCSYGLWYGQRWAWLAAIGFSVLHIVADVGFVADRAFGLDKVIGLVVIVGVLCCLTRSSVVAYVGVDASVLTDRLLLAGAAGGLLFPSIALVESATRPGYDPWVHFVSELSLSEYGWMQIANFIICATLILAGVLGLSRQLGGSWGPRLLGVYGLALLVAGVFVTDPTHGYPAGAENALPTTSGLLHGLAGLFCFNSLMIAVFVFGRYFSGRSRGWAHYSLATGLLVFAGNWGSLISSVLNESGRAVDAPTGLVQRVAIIVGWTWFAALALHVRGTNASSRFS